MRVTPYRRMVTAVQRVGLSGGGVDEVAGDTECACLLGEQVGESGLVAVFATVPASGCECAQLVECGGWRPDESGQVFEGGCRAG